MKYVVKCRYCGHSYIIDAKEKQEDFQCDNCGGQNSVEDVVERIEEPVIIEKEVIKTVVVKEEVDPDLQTIKNFDISKYGDGNNSDASTVQNALIFFAFLVFYIIIIIMQSLPKPETEEEARQRRVKEMFQEREDRAKISNEASLGEETIQQWMEAMHDKDSSALLNCYYLPEGTVYSEDDLTELIETTQLKDLWGTDVKIIGIDFYDYSENLTDYMSVMTNTALKIENIEYEVDFSNGYSRYFTVEKTKAGEMKIRLDGPNVLTSVTVQTGILRNENDDRANLYIDDIYIGSIDAVREDEEGIQYTLYTIPYISPGEHIFKVRTSLGYLIMSCEVTKDNKSIVLDKLQITEEQRQEIEHFLQYQWEEVQQAAFEYEEPYMLQWVFDDRIEDEEVEEIMKLIRMEHGLRGDLEGASIVDIRIGENIYAADYDTYIITVDVDYDLLNKSYAIGTCSSKLAITIDKDGYYKIYDAYDNKFFTLIEKSEEP